MRGKMEKKGHYELFETTHGHQILNLNDKYFYAIAKGYKGDILVGTDKDHEKKRTINQGKFYLVDFEDDPEFKDMPHLFLQDGDRYKEWLVPKDTPGKKGDKEKLIKTKHKVGSKKVIEHTEGKGNAGTEKQYRGKPEKLRSKSKNELYHMAQEKDIPGRSKMSKEELVDHLAQ
ncbi:MAG: Rho termination factor N-terminal domain-containing protein [Bacteroidota bacterium]